MEAKIIAKKDVLDWLKSLSVKMDVIAPVTDDGVTQFKAIEDVSKIDLDGPSPARKGLREQFTPETEVLFEYEVSGKTTEIKPEEAAPRERLIFGARACDAAALRYVDAVYSNVQPVDVPYFDRRKRTAMIGMFCNNPSWTCFCTEVGDFLTNPIEMDAYLTDIGDKYYVDVFTEKGAELTSSTRFSAASEADKKAAQDVREKTVSAMPKPVDHAKASESFDWDNAMWTKLAKKCLGCGACAYLCPTCHCFDIQECVKGTKGCRFRCWDTCQFEKFTLMGHGHNPRPSRKERTRQRVFHKFKYSPERYGILGCVGCGRCVAACPVNIDITKVVHELEEAPAKE